MKGMGPALMISIGPEGKPGGDKGDMGAESPGAMATEAFCRAKEAGDYAAAFDAFREMFKIVDEEDDDEMSDMGMMEG